MSGLRKTGDRHDAALEMEEIVAHATAQQRIASDPGASSWVGAAAGSGKTKVLIDRMLRLLLPTADGRPGSAPEKILALTFTKAGASEMAVRLSQRLSVWAVTDDDSLIRDMREKLLGQEPTAEQVAAARRLFARVVDTPGGLRIMTIHSFCQSVLGRFPVEAGLAPDFKPLEEAQAAALLDRARKTVIVRAGLQKASPEGLALAAVSNALNEQQFAQTMTRLIAERHQISQILGSFGPDGLHTALCAYFGIDPGMGPEEALIRHCTDPARDEPALREACEHLFAGKDSDAAKARVIDAFLAAAPADRPGLYVSYSGAFLTGKGEVFAKPATKAVLDKAPQIAEILGNEAQSLINFADTYKKILCASMTTHLFRLVSAIAETYRLLKEQEGALDFDDMILRTLSLLQGRVQSLSGLNADMAASWVMYKLDEGINHILVDEAQDTNPEQWEIVRLLSDEFFNGLGAKADIPRTMFAVGDEKQSIFGFQRAAPDKFGRMQAYFEKRILDAGMNFTPVEIATSFRSVQIVLDAVDTVFSDPSVARSLTSHYLTHRAKRQGQAGLVELWPVIYGDDQADDNHGEDTSWQVPDRIIELRSGAEKMASHIAETIRRWLDAKETLDSYARPIRPGDILILVKSRTAFVGELVRALKKRNVPVSGTDRMVLSHQLIVQDLCAAAAFGLLPEDDLALACLLKSPLVGLSEDNLFRLAHGRGPGISLWARVRESGSADIVQWLDRLIKTVSERPFEFFSRIVQEPCPADTEKAKSGTHAIYARLGEDAMDPLQEFLNLAMAYENDGCTSLQDFLFRHAESDIQIKRELDEAAGEVRIMTVHASKGLEAPIVFLPDTVRAKSGGHRPDSVMWPNKSELPLPFYVPSAAGMPQELAAARAAIAAKDDDEYRRLLYVAMTRAEERLYIGGFAAKRPKNALPDCWYTDITHAFDGLCGDPRLTEVPPAPPFDAPVLRFSETAKAAPDKTQSRTRQQTGAKPDDAALPGWLRQPMPEEPFPPRPLTPSKPEDEDVPHLSPLQPHNGYRFRRGTLTHRLFQLLPEIPKDRRAEAARAFLAKPGFDLPQALQESITTEVMAVMDDPAFGMIFDAGSMAEVPVAGIVGGRILSARIDRLLVRDDEIVIVDYKTNRPSPADSASVPGAYIRQVNIYAQAMREIYPGRRVRAALLWTDRAVLMEIPLDEAAAPLDLTASTDHLI